jgi:hypothetical protein
VSVTADVVPHAPVRSAQPLELEVEEREVELGVVDHELRAAHEVEEFLRLLGEQRLVAQRLVADAVHGERALARSPARG